MRVLLANLKEMVEAELAAKSGKKKKKGGKGKVRGAFRPCWIQGGRGAGGNGFFVAASSPLRTQPDDHPENQSAPANNNLTGQEGRQGWQEGEEGKGRRRGRQEEEEGPDGGPLCGVPLR